MATVTEKIDLTITRAIQDHGNQLTIAARGAARKSVHAQKRGLIPAYLLIPGGDFEPVASNVWDRVYDAAVLALGAVAA